MCCINYLLFGTFQVRCGVIQLLVVVGHGGPLGDWNFREEGRAVLVEVAAGLGGPNSAAAGVTGINTRPDISQLPIISM